MSKPDAPRDEAYWANHDLTLWGTACCRGAEYKVTGAPVAAGTKDQVRKISAGRKARGMASDSDLVR